MFGQCVVTVGYLTQSDYPTVRYFELVEDWLPKDAIIFRDEGRAYDTCFSKIQASAGIDKVIVYPPAVHELLSPNCWLRMTE